MKATISHINTTIGRYAAKFEDENAYLIFDLMDSSEPEVGDEISHPDFYSMGSETYKNLTQRRSFDVFVQNVCGPAILKAQLAL